MENYYHYFAAKKDLPNKADILQQEDNLHFGAFDRDAALTLINIIVANAKEANKSVAVRIMIGDDLTGQYFMEGVDFLNGLSWLERKEKVVRLSGHSSYYTFLSNMDEHLYDDLIFDESYGFVGGGFPIIVQDVVIGTVTVTGLRHNEDHELVVTALDMFKQSAGY